MEDSESGTKETLIDKSIGKNGWDKTINNQGLSNSFGKPSEQPNLESIQQCVTLPIYDNIETSDGQEEFISEADKDNNK